MATIGSILRGISRVFLPGQARKTGAPDTSTPPRPRPAETESQASEEYPPAAEELSHNEEVLANGEEIAMASSWIDSIRWHRATSELTMNTIKGGSYLYHNFPIEVAVEWVEHGSPGRFWWSFVRGVYSPATVLRRAPKKGGKGRANVVRLVH